ncbi:hypothetical protein QYF61_018302 [Mycteria americana]|uniref:Uncharacterized protein n=1 Tax=Mycteria americana TaxID=33587 RepID=A0AAN7NKT8_MYCAM|nr:hypothetical protein QYF61_018302 [Mycteria americana]
MDWPEGKDFRVLPEEEVTHAEEAPLYNKLSENEKQYALFTDGSCHLDAGGRGILMCTSRGFDFGANAAAAPSHCSRLPGRDGFRVCCSAARQEASMPASAEETAHDG